MFLAVITILLLVVTTVEKSRLLALAEKIEQLPADDNVGIVQIRHGPLKPLAPSGPIFPSARFQTICKGLGNHVS